MANVQQTLNKKKYECRWSWYDHAGKRHEQRKTFRTKGEAEQHRRDIENNRANQQSVDQNPGKLLLKVWAERWFASLDGKKKQSTLRGYRRVLDATVLKQLGHRPVAGITTWDVEQFIAALSTSGKAAPTVKRHVGVLSSVLKYAARHKAIPVNPCIGTELPADHRTTNHQAQALSPQQVEKLAQAMTEPPYGLMIRFMAYTGLRAGEVAGLHVGDLDLLRRQMHVRRTRTKVKGGWEVTTPKNNKARLVPLPRWLADDLAEYLAAHPQAKDPDFRDHPLWPGRTNGGQERFKHDKGSIDFDKPWERDAFYKRQFRPGLDRAGLPPIRLHDLRHTAASVMLMNGISLYKVAKILGHSVEVCERIYGHWIDDGSNVMDVLDRPSLKNA